MEMLQCRILSRSALSDKHVNLWEAQQREWDVAEWYQLLWEPLQSKHTTSGGVERERVCVCVCVCACVCGFVWVWSVLTKKKIYCLFFFYMKICTSLKFRNNRFLVWVEPPCCNMRLCQFLRHTCVSVCMFQLCSDALTVFIVLLTAASLLTGLLLKPCLVGWW